MVLIIIKKIDIYLSILSDQQSPYRENSVSLSPKDHKFIPKIINLEQKMETFFLNIFNKVWLKVQNIKKFIEVHHFQLEAVVTFFNFPLR